MNVIPVADMTLDNLSDAIQASTSIVTGENGIRYGLGHFNCLSDPIIPSAPCDKYIICHPACDWTGLDCVGNWTEITVTQAARYGNSVFLLVYPESELNKAHALFEEYICITYKVNAVHFHNETE